MAFDQSALLDLLGQLKLTDVPGRIQGATETLYQQLTDAEAVPFIGAAPFERSTQRTTHRNGSRPRVLSTTAGDLEFAWRAVHAVKSNAIPLARNGASVGVDMGQVNRGDDVLHGRAALRPLSAGAGSTEVSAACRSTQTRLG